MNRLRELRKERSLTLKSLSADTNISYSVLSYIETEKRPFTQENLEILAKYFKVSTDYLLGKSDIRNPNLIKAKMVAMDNSPNGVVEFETFIDKTKDLTTEDIEKIFEYIDFLKQRKTSNKGS